MSLPKKITRILKQLNINCFTYKIRNALFLLPLALKYVKKTFGLINSLDHWVAVLIVYTLRLRIYKHLHDQMRCDT
jgi:hypothetical protein